MKKARSWTYVYKWGLNVVIKNNLTAPNVDLQAHGKTTPNDFSRGVIQTAILSPS